MSAKGLQWLSSSAGLFAGFGLQMVQAGGLLYGSNGTVVDPEISRIKGQFIWPNSIFTMSAVVPDLAAGRVYFADGAQIGIFDMHSFAFLGSVALPLVTTGYPASITSLAQYSPDGLAAISTDGKLWLAQISAIPLLTTPVPSPQPPAPPNPGAGITTVGLAAQDLAYDASRNLLYASIPNSEAANGDQVVAIDPASGKVIGQYATPVDPRLLAISGDDSELYVTSQSLSNTFYSFSSLSESIQRIDLTSGVVSPGFGKPPLRDDYYYSVLSFTPLTGQPQSLAVVESEEELFTEPDGTTLALNDGPVSIGLFNGATELPAVLGPGTFNCATIQPGATSSRLYCATNNNFSRLVADSTGISVLDSSSLSSSNTGLTNMVFSAGTLYTSNGLVIDGETKTVTGTIPAQGSVAVDSGRVSFLAAPYSNQATIQSFDATTLKPIDARTIPVSTPDLTRLVACGQGRLAFAAGQEIYIVNPPSPAPQVPSISLVAPVDGSSPVIEAGSWVSIYGQNLASGVALSSAFPTSLGGVTVTIDGKPAYLEYVSPAQINVQAPDDTANGPVTVVVNGPNGAASYTVALGPYSPVLSQFGQGFVAAVIPTPNGSGAYGGGTYDLAGPTGEFSFVTRPVDVGETVELYGVGFGPTSPAVTAGQPLTGVAYPIAPITFTIGGVPAQVTFSGMTEAGLFQFNLVVPSVPSGNQLVQATVNITLNTLPAYLAVK